MGNHKTYLSVQFHLTNNTISNLKRTSQSKLLQSTEQDIVPKQLDLISYALKTCESKFCRCTACLIFPLFPLVFLSWLLTVKKLSN